MTDKDFKKYDLIVGWVAFAIALVTYGLTVEPTVSFWDCGEYISTSAKLEVGHPPGAPFFQMVGAFFAFFAPSADKVALFVNYMSVFSSAFTILFLYFIITNLTKKLALKDAENQSLSVYQAVAVLGSGFVGALAYTFSDSFWFNAVEAEVYAMAMLFMSAMFWLGIKWTDNLHTERGDKWLLLISLVVGLSFGVHFMALLTIPAIGMLYFFNSNFKKNIKNFIIANVISVAVLLLIFKLILPYTLAYFGYLEVFFVNSVGLPFNSGTIIAALSVVAFFFFALRYTYRNNKTHLQTITLCVLFVLIGFSSWLMIPIRANANVVINENSPTDARLLLAYYKLEQYPETHLFYGPMFSEKYAGLDEENPYKDGKPKYERDYKQNKYIVVNHYQNSVPNPNPKQVGFLPRMWSEAHAANYMMLTNYLDFSIKPEYFSNKELYQAIGEFKKQVQAGRVSPNEYDRFLSRFSEYLEVQKPSFYDNMKYMLSYQMGYMYFRYFMWNFAGRQDDIQGKMQDDHGNWLSGITFLDELRLGSQENLPSDVLNNKARNTYFFLPLLLGLIGLIFMLLRSEQKTWVVFVLFMFTGLALKVYLNERPFEPRERDYALVGSFFTFAIWIGVGVFALFDILKQYVTPKIAVPLTVCVTLLAVPTLMAYQNWDDHDRSGKYSAQAIAHAYLDSVQEDVGAMIFTIGDNDTFLLWYAQEIEGYRTDVRTINTSLLQTDWYIDQMKRKAYESDPIPSQLVHSQYAYGVRDVVQFVKKTENVWQVKDLINWIASDDPNTKLVFEDGRTMYYFPTNKIRIPVNKENVLKSGVVKPEDAHLMVDYIDIKLPSYVGKNQLIMLDIIANNNWERPIYFTGGSLDPQEYIWMQDYLQLDGLAYKLVPIKTPVAKNSAEMGRIDSELMYNIVTRWKWGNMGSSKIYHDIETRRNSITFRGNLARLAEQLIEEQKPEKAKNILDLAMKNMPQEHYEYYFSLDPYVTGYYKVGEPKKARELALKNIKKYQEELNYYVQLSPNEIFRQYANVEYVISRYMGLLVDIESFDKDFYQEQKQLLKKIISPFLSEDEFDEYEGMTEDSLSVENKSVQDTVDTLLKE
ncbi:DUF2723 domain-containing protein [Capnocytophaga sp.]|uniref:protein O-mannosyl-transferase family n=1 Tax=Capnocytophaga sp. TaxID=44737 RepID=UPI0026DD77D2|nr:DUF2723 domain-containing protein [Capnocytophaga sp.]MDO5104338.1 DUF2723 domain-containing protein [Capnocytophaga sp.]